MASYSFLLHWGMKGVVVNFHVINILYIYNSEKFELLLYSEKDYELYFIISQIFMLCIFSYNFLL